jgi:hypothetical protein
MESVRWAFVVASVCSNLVGHVYRLPRRTGTRRVIVEAVAMCTAGAMPRAGRHEGRRAISSRSNSARPPSIVNVSRPCGGVVSAHASLSERKPGAALGYGGEHIEKVPRRPGETVKPCHHSHRAPAGGAPSPARRGRHGRRSPSRGTP